MSESMNIARLKRGAESFEIVVNPDAALAVRKGQGSIADALVYPKVFSDAKKGMLASEQRMKALFETSDPLEVAKIIIEKGDVHLTAEYKKGLGEQKRRRIIDVIHRNAVDPRTGAPHPVSRIENALGEAKIRIDEFKPAEQQVDAIIKALRPIMPLKFVVKEVQLTIPGNVAPKCIGVAKHFGRLISESWRDDGAWQAVVEIPGGLEQELVDALNRVAHGHMETKVIRTRE